MNYTEWLLFFLFIQLLHFAGTWKLYVKAGRQAWEAAVPVYNAVILADIIKRPKWWVILLFFPIVNQLMFPVFWIETARSFGYNQRKDTILVVLTLGLYLFYINYATDAEYKKERSLSPRTKLGEWVSAIAFAIIAATMVHTYFMQPYTIPSSSLEKSLLVGDYLFVSKFHYGARVPMTTVALPMIHDSIPLTKKKSYLFSDDFEKRETALKNKLQLPYTRMPGFQKIKRNDIVVFNQPADTLLDMNDFHPDRNYYKPIDKKTNLVKRCVGIAGDSLEIRDGYVYINGKKNELPDRAQLQFYHTIYSSKGFSTEQLKRYSQKEFERQYVVTFTNNNQLQTLRQYFYLERVEGNTFIVKTDYKDLSEDLIQLIRSLRVSFKELNLNVRRANLTEEIAAKLRKNSAVDSVIRNIEPKGSLDPSVFPHIPSLGWNTDNFGPIYIPEAGATVELNEESIPFYKRIISEYEGNQLDIIGDNYFINGEKATSYTFKQDYYWMMGDNRQSSLDARMWGYVPFDHVVGKPVFIWFSKDDVTGGIRWERMFTTVGGSGEPVSYLLYFLIALGLYGLYAFVLKKRLKKAKK
jgi:signal peptidase I